jgi:hypothetical protein
MLEIQKIVKKIKEWFSAGEEALSNGCLPSGHKFSDYGMCLICGGYQNSLK